MPPSFSIAVEVGISNPRPYLVFNKVIAYLPFCGTVKTELKNEDTSEGFATDKFFQGSLAIDNYLSRFLKPLSSIITLTGVFLA